MLPSRASLPKRLLGTAELMVRGDELRDMGRETRCINHGIRHYGTNRESLRKDGHFRVPD